MSRVWLLLCAFAALACGSEPAPVFLAPAEDRVALVLEPPVVAVGEVAALDLSVVTSPGTSLRPFDLPTAVDGFFVVEREPTRVVKESARWVHHTRLRLRAVEVGRFEFPAGSLEVEAPEGGTAVLHYDALPLEVVSTLAAHPTQQSPYGVRLLPLSSEGGRGSVGAFVAGAALALASVGVLLLVRRRLAAAGAKPPVAAAQVPAWEIARSELARLRASVDGDPRRALDDASRALRRYAVQRFGGDATVRTCEELLDADPPFTLTTRWKRFVALLAALDAERFPPRPEPQRARELLDEVEAFVEETVPTEFAR